MIFYRTNTFTAFIKNFTLYLDNIDRGSAYQNQKQVFYFVLHSPFAIF